ncbi:TPA: methyl-accepting chemotaxis protein [Vibrio cholerae]|uniref:Methyl-accepting chemotaxis protein n=56 Tax=Gammaproteobacteria TaxID=1236 RepID=A0A0H5Z0D5_VIBCL|nr:methyl-accepting chemotaxis protein [Vibrio cholerae]EAZ73518.1 methyl-accepting chemotaxis protein [Vibrio cholerae NCTC 8457]EYC46787.1 chemotaxis protein [Vibrio cholerae O1 biovar El Tor str. L-3226]MDG6207365.1 methyl-accepting chemotaxis protein [Vibrio sp. NO3-D2]ABQ20964.1 methyl-accepting chemotaxis protein [Vibrio cholerae O395]ACP05791.1 methyl-accepting chemotaxis protein [Vibrio cholerae M66-2]
MALTKNLSLTQTLGAVFLCITILMISLSVTSLRGIERVGAQFNQLSEQALPFALNNAALTQNFLEQVKYLGYGTRSQSEQELNQVLNEWQKLDAQAGDEITRLQQNVQLLSSAEAVQQAEQLQREILHFQQLAQSILKLQQLQLSKTAQISEQAKQFRYGLSSIGPEMGRIASFLAVDNPEAMDAANRFTASASAMESAFLLLFIEEEMSAAQKYRQELKNRVAGLELAFDDFKEWYPEIKDYASLTAPYEMVLAGFQAQAVIEQIINKLEDAQQQNKDFASAAEVAQQLVTQLNQWSTLAQQHIVQGKQEVTSTISAVTLTQQISGTLLVLAILAVWFGLRRWIGRALNNITRHLAQLTQHKLNHRLDLVGPQDFQNVAAQLNQVIVSTHESLALVTRNCETLYQTAELSHGSAEQSNQSLAAQNQALLTMAATINQLDASIREIAGVSHDSYTDSVEAAEHSAQGVKVIEQNQQRLQALETTLAVNDAAMSELNQRVTSIREMVDMISGIADSTNLLALNAAIEAARAGEQGRGFAVVADEVRKLASDTSKQTTNIRDMMNELVTAASKSRQAVDESRKEMVTALQSSEEVKSTFMQIERAVAHIRTRVEQITQATEEQKRATADVNKAVAQISEQGQETKRQLDAMLESAEQVAEIAGHQQAMLHKYELN